MTKRKRLIIAATTTAAIWPILICTLLTIQHRLNRETRPAAQQQIINSPAYWDAPAFSFTDQDAKTVTNADLRGHIWIADFFFTQCTSACPLLTSRLVLLQKQLRSPEIRFVSFSVDPEHDTQDELKKYAALYQGDESRWRLLRTDPKGLTNVATGMKVVVASSGDKDNPILHSSTFLLIDREGKVRGLYDSVDSEAVNQLAADARSLAGDHADNSPAAVAVGSTAVERGHALFMSMGCLACHSQPRIAPPLQSLYGSMVRLDNHKMVWADEAYLHESIVDPNAKVVAGYSMNMPSYRDYLNDTQVKDLVTYLKSLSTNAPSGHGMVDKATTAPEAAELLTDPVCKMQVTNDPSAPRAEFNRKTYFFCSNKCKEQFVKNPGAYAAQELLP